MASERVKSTSPVSSAFRSTSFRPGAEVEGVISGTMTGTDMPRGSQCQSYFTLRSLTLLKSTHAFDSRQVIGNLSEGTPRQSNEPAGPFEKAKIGRREVQSSSSK